MACEHTDPISYCTGASAYSKNNINAARLLSLRICYENTIPKKYKLCQFNHRIAYFASSFSLHYIEPDQTVWIHFDIQ
jgi:hypothetical protein